ncbi:hypothetical protein EIP86_003409 [Pleurotus ostreatoroseus]|nr:hypothetical protein EIP86_003409 [Pleurotus ostreatoroseus]
MALPIGQKTGRWMEQDFRPAFTPSDTGYYDGDDEEEEYERSFVDDYGGYIEEEDLIEEVEESLSTEIHFSPKPLMRPLRSPSGPRRMPNSPLSSPYRGLGLSMPSNAASPTSPPHDHSLDGIHGIADVFGKARRRSVDSSSTSIASCSDLRERTSTVAVSAHWKESRPSATGQADEHILCDESAAGTDEYDYSWEAQDDSYDKINATTAVEPSSTLDTVPPVTVPISPLRISKRMASSTSSLPSNTQMGVSEGLAEPFDLKPAEEVEVSTFEWDSDDETPGDGLRRRLSKLRQAIRNSVSVPSLKPSSRRISEGSSSSSSTSPESVSSLRARQAASPSPDGHNRLWKLATDLALSPIPGSPVITPPDTFVPFPEVQSPPTPATPISPDTVEFHSFLHNVFRDGPTVPTAAATRPAAKPPSRPPPDLPLPPTPPLLSSPYTPPRLRERGNDQGTNQPSPPSDQRLTVVDPDTSMARLEMSMAKLEGYAPRLEPRRRAVSDAAAKKKHRSKPSRSQVDVAINIDDTHARETLVPLKPLKSMQPFRLSQSSTSTSDPSSGASTSGGIYARREPTIQPVNMKRRRQGDQKKSLRPPSLALLPMFDFEEPGHKVLDIASDLPPRTASLENRTAGLRLHSQAIFAGVDAESSYSDSQLSLPMTQSYSTDMVDRLVQPNTPPGGPKRGQEGLSSFMHFTPRQSEPRSRVRRLLDRVHVRGLRAPFGPQTQPV